LLDSTVMEDVYSTDSVDILDSLNTFYHQYLVPIADSSVQVFQSFTYGEMVISLLLALIFLTMVFRWIWEALR